MSLGPNRRADSAIAFKADGASKARAPKAYTLEQDRVVRVADHDAGDRVLVGPAVPDVADRLGVVVHGLGDVAGHVRGEQGEELDLAAVDVPAGERRVVVLSRRDLEGLAVHAGVGAVHVLEDVRLEQRVVEVAVEGALLLSRCRRAIRTCPSLAFQAARAFAATWSTPSRPISAARLFFAPARLT